MRRKDREITDASAIDSILAEADSCSLALMDGDWPYVIALNYGFEREADGHIVMWFHCAREGKKLQLIRNLPRAAFFADTGHELITGPQGCDWGMNFKSVAGTGTIAIVSDHAEKRRGLDLLMEHYAGKREFEYDERIFAATEILRLDVLSVSAKQKS